VLVTLVCSYCGAELVKKELHPDKREIAAWISESAPDRCPRCGAKLYGTPLWDKISVEIRTVRGGMHKKLIVFS
jgi:DNA-directed RNA polymerase subunit RPC12/RpoP